MHNKQIIFKCAKILFLSLLTFIMFPTMQAVSKDCPQARNTKKAPANFLSLNNPLKYNSSNIKAGENLYHHQAKPIACKFCHGVKGDGKGDPDFESTPSARNFTCTKTMETLLDGQLYWVIKNGSKNTSMFAFSNLSDRQVWQLVLYIRQFAK